MESLRAVTSRHYRRNNHKKPKLILNIENVIGYPKNAKEEYVNVAPRTKH